MPTAKSRLAPLSALALVAVVILGIDLGGRVLATNDEARFPLLAADMLRHGHWFFPHLDGAVYYNKPLLLAWLIALVSWPAGHVTQLTAVLPSLLAGVGTVLAVYATARALFGDEAGRYAALVMATTQGLALHARVPMPDMLMTAFVTASIWLLARMRRGIGRFPWAGFAALVAAGFWAKGPAAFMAVAVALAYAIVARESGARARLHLGAGIALAAVLVAPWFVVGLVGARHAVDNAVVTDQLLWYTPRGFRAAMLAAPLQHLFGILFPWALVAPFALMQAARSLRGRGAERDGVAFGVVWALVTFVGVALSREQRLRYYLPAGAAVAVLIGWRLADTVDKRRRVRVSPWWWALGGALVVLLGVAAALTRNRGAGEWGVDLPGSALETVVLGAALLTFTGALVHGALRGRPERAFGIACVAAAVFVVGQYHWEVSRRNVAYDFPRLTTRAAPWLADDHPIGAWNLPAMPLAFYSGRDVRTATGEPHVREILAGDGRVFMAETALGALPERDALSVLVADRLASRPVVLVAGRAPRASILPPSIGLAAR